MFKTRLISGAVLLGLAVLFMYLGGIPLLVVTCAISLIGQRELYRLRGEGNDVLSCIGYIATVLYYINMAAGALPAMLIITLFVAACMCAIVIKYPSIDPAAAAHAFFGFIYAPVMLSYIPLVRSMENGMFLMVLIFICAWG